MIQLNKYGEPPFKVVLIHGGPGAAGEMSTVAQELASICGILEPLQTEKSIEGQLLELKCILEKKANLPIILIGFSWGAWLSYIFTSMYPLLVKKLILIGSGPFEEGYIKNLMETRLDRLNSHEKQEIAILLKKLKDPSIEDKNNFFKKLGELSSKADSFDPLPDNSNHLITARYDIYEAVWAEAKNLRASGKLLQYGKNITCPVIAIHGDYDSHSPEGVKEPLSRILKQFHFILLKECGHCPWVERKAKEQFYTILKQELVFTS